MNRLAITILVTGSVLGTCANLSAWGTEAKRDAPLGTSGRLSGTLYVAKGKPVPYVIVCEISEYPETELKCTTSNSSGRFDLGEASQGIHFLRIKATGYRPYIYKVKVDAKSKATLRLQITPAG